MRELLISNVKLLIEEAERVLAGWKAREGV